MLIDSSTTAQHFVPINTAPTMDNVQINHNPIAIHNQVTQAIEETYYYALTLKWDYEKCTVELSMPNYIDKALHKFQHPKPKRPEHSPYIHNIPQYGAKVQMTDPIDTTLESLKKTKASTVSQQ